MKQGHIKSSSMYCRLIVVLLLLPIILGATNSSHSVFRLEFVKSKPSSESLLAAAKVTLNNSGYHLIKNIVPNKLQYGDAQIWVSVLSPVDGLLELSFFQLRSGCGNNPEVIGAKDISVKVYEELEARYGDITVTEEHYANYDQ